MDQNGSSGKVLSSWESLFADAMLVICWFQGGYTHIKLTRLLTALLGMMLWATLSWAAPKQQPVSSQPSNLATVPWWLFWVLMHLALSECSDNSCHLKGSVKQLQKAQKSEDFFSPSEIPTLQNRSFFPPKKSAPWIPMLPTVDCQISKTPKSMANI